MNSSYYVFNKSTNSFNPDLFKLCGLGFFFFFVTLQHFINSTDYKSWALPCEWIHWAKEFSFSIAYCVDYSFSHITYYISQLWVISKDFLEWELTLKLKNKIHFNELSWILSEFFLISSINYCLSMEKALTYLKSMEVVCMITNGLDF